MPDKPGNPFKFWEELNRRKVVRVMIGYLASAYVLLELTSIVAEPLGLPHWTLNFVLVLLCIGFVITVIISWIYDFTPEGLKKTEGSKDLKLKAQSRKDVKWKLKISDLVIAVLIIAILILSYPKVFNKNKNLNSMTMLVTFINEVGIKETKQIFKDEYVHKIMILPFQPEEPDSAYAWLKYGILDAIKNDLNQFQYIVAYGNPESVHLQEQINEAKLNNCQFFLTGTYRASYGNYKVTCKLHQAENGSIKELRVFQGDDIFEVIDDISLQARIDMGVPDEIINSCPDLPVEEHMTRNMDAFRLYISAYYYKHIPGGRLINNYLDYGKALELDSTFALAASSLAYDTYLYFDSKITAQKNIDRAMLYRGRLPESSRVKTEILNYLILEDIDNAIVLSEMQYNLHPNDINILLALISLYDTNLMFSKAEAALERLNELVPDYPVYQIKLARMYLQMDKIEVGLKFMEKLIEEKPDHIGFLLYQGLLFLHNNDLDSAEEVFRKGILLSPEIGSKWSLMIDHINYLRNNNPRKDDLLKFTGKFQSGGTPYPIECSILNDHLYRKSPNQVLVFLYSTSDSSFFGFYDTGTSVHRTSFSTNSRGKVFKLSNRQNDGSPGTYWKQDSLILSAIQLLESRKYQEALIAFQEAYSEYPEHQFLNNYIKHCSFIQSQKYETSKSLTDSYIGQYVYDEYNVDVYKLNDELYINDYYAREFKILPISEDSYMNPNILNYVIEFVKKDGKLGMKAVLNNGLQFDYYKIN